MFGVGVLVRLGILARAPECASTGSERSKFDTIVVSRLVLARKSFNSV